MQAVKRKLKRANMGHVQDHKKEGVGDWTKLESQLRFTEEIL